MRTRDGQAGDEPTPRVSERWGQATVIGDSSASPGALADAERVGEMLARAGVTLVTGGQGGVMEAASRGAMSAGGLVVGILPSSDPSTANPWCSVVIPTGMGHARNVLTVLAADLVVSIGGAAGTLSEICFSWMHDRPILLLEGHGGWSERLGGVALDHRRTSPMVSCPDLPALEAEVLRIMHARGLRRRLAGRSHQPPREE